MLNEFLNYIKQENLFLPESRILLAVSGGLDSVVMTDLFFRSGFSFGMAHVNFALRGEESERDEQFVRNLANKYQSRIFCIRFDARNYARKNKLSVQMAARQLRYDWFRQVAAETGFNYVATAHHLDDQIETFLINLLRGTGIAGLHGIPSRQGIIIRPLLFASRLQLEHYAQDNTLEYVEDSSNASRKYTRNRIRHSIIPQFEKINPAFRNEFAMTIRNIREAEAVYRSIIEKEKNRLLLPHGDGYQIPLDILKQYTPIRTWLYEMINPFNFTAAVTNDILHAIDDPSGRIFFSPTHRIVKDRDYLLVDALEKGEDKASNLAASYHIYPSNHVMEYPVKLSLELHSATGFVLTIQPNTACLDYDRLKFPLIIRKWKRGDSFYPLGMKGKKKLSDFFIDQKFSIPQKEKTWLLCCGKDIVWIIGHRIDDRYKITPETMKVLRISMLQSSDAEN